MKIKEDGSISLGSGDFGSTEHPGCKERKVLKTHSAVSCIGRLDELTAYMKICLKESPDRDLERIHEALCSLFVVLPFDGLSRLGDPVDETELEDDEILGMIIKMSLLSKHLYGVILTKRTDDICEDLESTKALRLNYLRAMARSFEREVYLFLLERGILAQGSTEELTVIDGAHCALPIKSHFAVSEILRFVNILSDYILTLTASCERSGKGC